MDDKAWWLALHLVPGVGRITFKKLVESFGHPRQVMQATSGQLMRVSGIGPKIAQAITGFQAARAVERELRAAQSAGCQIITQGDESYPPLLKTIEDPPPVLYVKGDWGDPIGPGIAVVGSRRPSIYGKVVAEQLARGLAECGIIVVSGLARGIDSVAHLNALENGGRTIAILGCGLAYMYPPENLHLAERISHQGAVVSEFPMATKPDRLNFPLRNRSISGLSLGTVVVEAGERSGALITAQWALDQGREVFAVPGNVTAPTSRGTNRLIKMGAKLVECVDDILEELPPYALGGRRARAPAPEELCQAESTSDERRLLELLDPVEARHIDWIIEYARFPTSVVSSLLLKLELEGKVTQLPGKLFLKVIR
ncbi:MAG TPA: DNA-processing protein DprA [Candidatus Tectomicrobia bacterium]|nr:DNA-processing protein DprA [Candidatus Tectomicrobia bacterium]